MQKVLLFVFALNVVSVVQVPVQAAPVCLTCAPLPVAPPSPLNDTTRPIGG